MQCFCRQLYGAVATLASALTYSMMNLMYDYTVQTTENPPPHPVMMAHMARIGLIANGLYTAAFTVCVLHCTAHEWCSHGTRCLHAVVAFDGLQLVGLLWRFLG